MKEYYKQIKITMLKRKKSRILNQISKLLANVVSGKIIKVDFLGLDSDFIFWDNRHKYINESTRKILKHGIKSYERLMHCICELSNINREITFLTHP